MFILSKIADTIRIDPADFTKRSINALEDNINEKYANKVIPQVGLCICFYDLLKTSDGLVGQGQGGVHVNVEFRLIVFRPFKGEIIEGRISNSTTDNIQISLNFFDQITIPTPTNIFPNSHFDKSENVWIWTNADERYFFDVNERVRFRVEEEVWEDTLALSSASGGRSSSSSNAVPFTATAIAATAGRAPSTADATGNANTRANTDAGIGAGAQSDGARNAGIATGVDAPFASVGRGFGAAGAGGGGRGGRQTLTLQQRGGSTWRLVGSMQQAGLGLVSWW